MLEAEIRVLQPRKKMVCGDGTWPQAVSEIVVGVGQWIRQRRYTKLDGQGCCDGAGMATLQKQRSFQVVLYVAFVTIEAKSAYRFFDILLSKAMLPARTPGPQMQWR